MVLTAPFAAAGAPRRWLHRPRPRRGVSRRCDHAPLHEGQGTTSRLHVDDAGRRRARHPGARPRAVRGAAARRGSGRLTWSVGDRRCPPSRSARAAGAAARSATSGSALTSAWAGYRWGPVGAWSASRLQVLPARRAVRLAAEVPQPARAWSVAHRSRRLGRRDRVRLDPALPGRRPAAPDQLARCRCAPTRCTWSPPAPSRTPACCCVVDALADHGALRRHRRGGQQPRPDRARRRGRSPSTTSAPGDRVGLRVVGPGGESAGYGTGSGTCGASSAGWPRVRPGDAPRPRARPAPAAGRRPARWSSCSRRCSPTRWHRRPRRWPRRGLPVLVVIDTLPAERRRRSSRAPTPRSPSWPGGCAGSSGDERPRPARRARLPGRAVARAGHARRRAAPARPSRPAAPGARPVTPVIRRARSRGQWALRLVVVLGAGAGAAVPTVPAGAVAPRRGWCCWCSVPSPSTPRLPDSAGRPGALRAGASVWWGPRSATGCTPGACSWRPRCCSPRTWPARSRRYGPAALRGRPATVVLGGCGAGPLVLAGRAGGSGCRRCSVQRPRRRPAASGSSVSRSRSVSRWSWRTAADPAREDVMARIDPEEYAELVLRCVEQVPRGRVTTYGAIAEVGRGRARGRRSPSGRRRDGARTAGRCRGGGWCAPTARCRPATRARRGRPTSRRARRCARPATSTSPAPSGSPPGRRHASEAPDHGDA